MQAQQWRDLLLAGLLPFAVAAVSLFVLAGLWRKTTRASAPRPATTAAILLAVIASRLALEGWPEESWERSLYGIGALGAVALGWSFLPTRWWTGLIAGIAGAAACGLVSQTIFFASDPTWSRFLPFIATAVVVASVEPSLEKSCGPTTIVAIGLGLAPTIGIIILSGNVTVSLIVAAVASALLAVFGLAVWRHGVSLARGSMLIIVGAMHLALITAWLQSYDLPRAFIPAFLLAAFAPLGLLLGAIPGVSNRPKLARAARILGVASCGSAGFLFALSASDTSAYY